MAISLSNGDGSVTDSIALLVLLSNTDEAIGGASPSENNNNHTKKVS
jgi:hypothetical protein